MKLAPVLLLLAFAACAFFWPRQGPSSGSGLTSENGPSQAQTETAPDAVLEPAHLDSHSPPSVAQETSTPKPAEPRRLAGAKQEERPRAKNRKEPKLRIIAKVVGPTGMPIKDHPVRAWARYDHGDYPQSGRFSSALDTDAQGLVEFPITPPTKNRPLTLEPFRVVSDHPDYSGISTHVHAEYSFDEPIVLEIPGVGEVRVELLQSDGALFDGWFTPIAVGRDWQRRGTKTGPGQGVIEGVPVGSTFDVRMELPEAYGLLSIPALPLEQHGQTQWVRGTAPLQKPRIEGILKDADQQVLRNVGVSLKLGSTSNRIETDAGGGFSLHLTVRAAGTMLIRATDRENARVLSASVPVATLTPGLTVDLGSITLDTDEFALAGKVQFPDAPVKHSLNLQIETLDVSGTWKVHSKPSTSRGGFFAADVPSRNSPYRITVLGGARHAGAEHIQYTPLVVQNCEQQIEIQLDPTAEVWGSVTGSYPGPLEIWAIHENGTETMVPFRSQQVFLLERARIGKTKLEVRVRDSGEVLTTSQAWNLQAGRQPGNPVIRLQLPSR